MERMLVSLKQIIERAPWLAGYRVFLAVNPKAGGFHNPKLKAQRAEEIASYTAQADLRPLENSAKVSIYYVEESGAFEKKLKEIEKESAGSPVLAVALGGDGMASEVAKTFACGPENLCRRAVLFMAPMGTGNDGSGAEDMFEACRLLHLGPEAGILAPAKTLKLALQKRPSLYAFNIISLGIDAFIGLATNKVKLKFPGNSYKIIIGFAALVYGLFYRIKKSRIKAVLTDGSEYEFSRKLLLLCVGYQGRAKYGSGQSVLPGDENVCALGWLPVWKRILNKNRIASGRHRFMKETDLFSSYDMVYDYGGKIVAQTDGECAVLQAENFPAHISVYESGALLLKSRERPGR